MRVCRMSDLHDGKGVALTLAGERIALFLSGNAVYAVEDRCPHRGAPLSRGLLHDRCYVACLDHGWSVSLTDGQAQPPEHGQVRTYAVQIVDAEVLVAIPSAA